MADMLAPNPLDPLTLRQTFGAYPTGIALIAAEIDEKPVGMLANSFTSVSLDPPLASMSFARTSTTWPVLSQARQVGISVLQAGNRAHVGLLRRPATHRFDGVDMDTCGDSALLLPRAAATLTAELHSVIEAGDHVMSLFQITGHHRDHDATPLVFHNGQLHELAR